MKITCFGQVSFPAEGFVFQGQSSRSRIPVVEVQVIDLMKTAGSVLCLPCGHQTREACNFPAEVFVLQGQSSRSRIPVVEVQVIDLMKTAGSVLCLPCGDQTREAACAGSKCARP